jgi:regulatory protein
LRSKGIDDELARSALDTIGADDERQAAEQLVARRLRSVRGLPRDKQVARLAGMLARKGYSGGLAIQVVREALDADGHSADEDA